MRSWQRDFEDAWGGQIRLEPEAYFDLGQDTLLFYVLHGWGKHSGVEVAMPVGTVFRWHDGLLIYFRGYSDRADALSDLRVSHDSLQPIEP
jgi:hypothetical protein